MELVAGTQALPLDRLSSPTEELQNVEGGLNAYLTWMKNMGCVGCHQLGNEATRTIPVGSPTLCSFMAWVGILAVLGKTTKAAIGQPPWLRI